MNITAKPFNGGVILEARGFNGPNSVAAVDMMKGPHSQAAIDAAVDVLQNGIFPEVAAFRTQCYKAMDKVA